MTVHDPLLRTRQVARALKVSGSTIKRWVDAGELGANRTVGNHRLIPLTEAFRFARRHGFSPAGLEELAASLAAPAAAAVVDDGLRGALTDALRLGDRRRVRVLI